MTQFIMIPAIIGIITLGIYKLFELFARRRERIMLIEKLDPAQLPTFNIESLRMPGGRPIFTSNALSIGCLLIGLGLGILAGAFLWLNVDTNDNWIREAFGGASVLLFGGLGLIASVVVGRWMERRDREKE